MTTTNWQVSDLDIRLGLCDQMIGYLEDVRHSESRFCCDVNVRLAIQLACQHPADKQHMNRLRRVMNDRLLQKIERDHRPKAAAAIEFFKQFYREWASSGAAEDEPGLIELEESIDDFMVLADDD